MNEPTIPPASNPSPTGETDNSNSGGPDRLASHANEVKKRGTKPGSVRGPYKKRGEPSPEKPTEPVKPIVPLFNEQNTIRLLRTPFNIVAVKTRCALMALDQDEEKELTATAVPFLNEWVAVDPKWIAAFMFAYSLGSIALAKVMIYMAWVDVQKMQARAKQQEEQPKAPIKEGPKVPQGGDNLAPGELPPEMAARMAALSPTVAPQ